MPTKIRLQRRGKKGQPFYHIVIADGRAPRDGKFIDKIGTYNPLSKPAEIDINFDRAVQWLQNGAQPTDTVRSILSLKGVLYKNHLQTGVRKGAMTQEQADVKFDEWLKDKQERLLAHIKQTELEHKDDKKKRLDAEAKVKEERAKKLAAKRAQELKAMEAEHAGAEAPEAQAEEPAVAEAVAEDTAAEPVAEAEAATEAVAEEPVAEEPVAIEEVTETVVAEEPAAEETVAEEPVAEAMAEEVAVEELPVEEPVAEAETAAEETTAEAKEETEEESKS